jgi:threonine aldolase
LHFGGGIEENLPDMKTATENESIVDLRSDTFTKPTPAMRRAMAEAEVGDDVYGEDPTVNRLQERAAEIFEREAALFVPSGSMGNLLAIRTHAQPTNEVICEAWSHVSLYELGSMCTIAGCLPRTVRVPGGFLTWEIIEPLIREKIYYDSQTKLVTLENTSNMHGGVVYPQEIADDVCDKAHAAGLKVHLDGARIFNAAIALESDVRTLASYADSVTFCLSKGLGCPVGSLLCGTHDFITQAHRVRKLLGGGMRQAGIIAAAGIVALETMVERLAEDHLNASALAKGLARVAGIKVQEVSRRTNMVFFELDGDRSAQKFQAALKGRKVLVSCSGSNRLRAVTHVGIDRKAIDQALTAAAEAAGEALAA